MQSDHTILLEAGHPKFPEVRDGLAAFAELEKSPEYVHTYRITPLSVWNAAAAGMSAETIIHCLEEWSKFEIPPSLVREIHVHAKRYGLIRLETRRDTLVLTSGDVALLHQVISAPQVQPLVEQPLEDGAVPVKHKARGKVKQELLKAGYPVEDVAGYSDGERLQVRLRKRRRFASDHISGKPWRLFIAKGPLRGEAGCWCCRAEREKRSSASE